MMEAPFTALNHGAQCPNFRWGKKLNNDENSWMKWLYMERCNVYCINVAQSFIVVNTLNFCLTFEIIANLHVDIWKIFKSNSVSHAVIFCSLLAYTVHFIYIYIPLDVIPLQPNVRFFMFCNIYNVKNLYK